MRLVLASLVVLAACSKSNPNCERAVRHVMTLSLGPPGTPAPSSDEQAVIDQIARVTLERCTDEGLSDAQRDCILAAPSLTDRTFLTCPALVATRPSWIIAPIGEPERLDKPPFADPPAP